MKWAVVNHWLVDTALLLNRVSLGLYFCLAGVSKLTGGVGKFVNGPYQAMVPGWLPQWFATPYGYSLPWVEAVIGGLLAIGLLGRVSAGMIALMLLSFIIVTGVAAEHGPFHTNVILLTLALLLTVSGPGRYSVGMLLCKRCKS